MQIKKITPNKKLPAIYEIEFFDYPNLIYIHTDTLLKLGLKKNIDLEVEVFEELETDSVQTFILADSKRKLLSGRYSTNQIIYKIKTSKLYLLNKEKVDIDWIIQKLQSGGFLNDSEYARYLIHKLKDQKIPKGRNAIVQKLRLAGVSEDLYNNMLEEYSDKEEIEDAQKVAEKFIRVKKLNLESYDDKNKLKRHLLYRGYDFSTINGLIDRL